jgi:thiol-disulfide isomerase/thioredoxin
MTHEGAEGARLTENGAPGRGVAGILLACLLAACGVSSRSPAAVGADGPGGTGPKVEFADLDRIHAILTGLRGRPVFVNFWATWCVPCVEELPDLAALSQERDVRGAEFVGISLDAWITGNGAETEDKVKRALAAAGIDYPNLIYRGDQDPLLEGFQLPGPIPYSVLYDAQGKQAGSWTGKPAIGEIRRAIAAAAEPGRASATARPSAAAGGR